MLRLTKFICKVKHVANPSIFRKFSVDKGEFVVGNLHYIKMPPVMDAKVRMISDFTSVFTVFEYRKELLING